jgi:hypothetical protein
MNHSTIQGLSVRSFSSLFVRPLLAGCFCWRAGSWISQPVRFNSRSDCTRQGMQVSTIHTVYYSVYGPRVSSLHPGTAPSMVARS